MALDLICPKCRHIDAQGQLHQHFLLDPLGNKAVLGALDDVQTLQCSHCQTLYPVIRGIPVIFERPAAQTLSYLPFGLDLPMPTLMAWLGQVPYDLPLAKTWSRLARYAWAAFHQGFPEHLQWPHLREFNHAVQLMHWLKAHGENGERRLLLGGAFAREAWESQGKTIVLDAHLPTLLLLRDLIQKGEIEIPFPKAATGWIHTYIRWPKPKAQIDLVCADAANPPFRAHSFSSVIASNLIDSTQNPFLVVGQAHALTAPHGFLTLSSPYTWKTEVTPLSAWPIPGPNESSKHRVRHWVTAQFDPPFQWIEDIQIPWAMRVSEAETLFYLNDASLFQAPSQ